MPRNEKNTINDWTYKFIVTALHKTQSWNMITENIKSIKIWESSRIETQEPCNIKLLWSNKCIARGPITKWNLLPTLLLLFRLLSMENLFTKHTSNHSYLRISIPKTGLWSKPGLNLLWSQTHDLAFLYHLWCHKYPDKSAMMLLQHRPISIDVTILQTNQHRTPSDKGPTCKCITKWRQLKFLWGHPLCIHQKSINYKIYLQYYCKIHASNKYPPLLS